MDLGPTPLSSGHSLDLDASLDSARWSSYQKFVLALTAVVLVLDGLDTQIVAFAAPALTKAWGLSKNQLAPLLTIGLIGMLIGNFAGGIVGDRVGRRRGLIGSVLIFGTATIFLSLAKSMEHLLLLRLTAGIGLGAALPNAASLVAEFTPRRHLNLAVTATIVCAYLGGFVGGGVAALLLPQQGWRALFVVAGAMPLLAALALMLYLPESPRFLVQRPDQWTRLREITRRCGLAITADTAFERTALAPHDNSVREILSRTFRRDTFSVWLAFFCSLSAVYLALSWLPSMLAESGHSLANASAALMYFNLGGVLFALLAAKMTGRFGSRFVLLLMATGGALGALALAAFPLDPVTPPVWMALALAFEGGCVGGLQTVLYALSAHIYPTRMRATGMGTAAMMGRLGAILMTLLGANILAAGGGTGMYLTLAVGLIGTSVAIALIRRHVAPQHTQR